MDKAIVARRRPVCPAPERFQAKRKPVRVEKTRQPKNLERDEFRLRQEGRSITSPSPRSSRGEGWGEGLPPQIPCIDACRDSPSPGLRCNPTSPRKRGEVKWDSCADSTQPHHALADWDPRFQCRGPNRHSGPPHINLPRWVPTRKTWGPACCRHSGGHGSLEASSDRTTRRS